MSKKRTFYFLVFMNVRGLPPAQDRPIGGLVFQADDMMAAMTRATCRALRRYPTRPWEILDVVPVGSRRDKRRAVILQEEKEAGDLWFEEVMKRPVCEKPARRV